MGRVRTLAVLVLLVALCAPAALAVPPTQVVNTASVTASTAGMASVVRVSSSTSDPNSRNNSQIATYAVIHDATSAVAVGFSAAVPTLSAPGLLTLAILVALSAAVLLRRRLRRVR